MVWTQGSDMVSATKICWLPASRLVYAKRVIASRQQIANLPKFLAVTLLRSPDFYL